MFEKFLSRKFIVTVLSSVFLSGSAALGLHIPTETILAVSGIIASYVLGASYVDGKIPTDIVINSEDVLGLSQAESKSEK